ncbi:caspase family protein, partial [bacterium]|nr:caspase family protein [bacterium]
TSTYAFSPDSTYLIAGSWVGALDGHASAGTTIRQWDIEQNTFKEFRGASPTVFDLYITKDKQKIISMSSEGTGDGTVTIRNVNGTIETRIITKDRPIERMLVSKDEKYIITLSRRKHIGVWEDHKVNIWSIDGKMVREFKSTREVEYTLAAGLNHQYIVASSKATIDFLDFNGKKINSVPGKIKGIKTHIELSPDGKIIATNDHKINGTIFLKSMDGTFEKELKGHKWKVYKFQFSPDGSYIVTTSANSPNVWVWDLQGNSIQTIKHGLGFHIKSLAISSDSKMIATGGDDNNISLWSRTGEFLKYLPGHTNEVYSLTFSDEPSHLISGSMDGTVRVWNIANRQHYTMLADGNEWMIFDSQGNFDTSTNGGKLVAMVKGMSFWGVDQFALKNNRPDLILETVEMGAKPEIQNYYQQYKKRLRKAGITEQELFKEFHIPSVTILKTQVKGKNATIDFQMNDTKFDLKNYTVFVNDVPLFGAYGKKVNGKKIDLIENIELTNGKNKIEISCLNEKGAESYRAITYAEYRKPTKGNLYFIGFGVSIYQDRNLNLKYADKDVKDLASVFSKMKGKQFNQVQIRTFLNEKVTDESIKQAKTVLKNATPDDTLVLFIAGHGVHDQDRDATYYYLPHQADINNLSNTGISFESIEDILQGIPPRNKLFLMDTCESGEVEDSVQNHYFSIASSRGIKARTTRAIKLVNKKNNPAIQSRHFLYQKDRYIFNDLIRRSGTIVFSSSKGGEFSYESEKIENGYFTEEIIKGLQGRADRNSDKLVTSDELRDYVEKIVPKHTQNLQHPTVDRDNIFQKIEFPIVGQ